MLSGKKQFDLKINKDVVGLAQQQKDAVAYRWTVPDWVLLICYGHHSPSAPPATSAENSFLPEQTNLPSPFSPSHEVLSGKEINLLL